MAKRQRPVISMLVVRGSGQGTEILLQRRTKDADDDTPYAGFLELPQGKVQSGESIQDAARRELLEETGLRLDCTTFGEERPAVVSETTSQLLVCRPLLVVADKIQNHIGIAIVVTAEGNVTPTAEASGHEWVLVSAMRNVLQSERIFPLNRPMIEEYLDHFESDGQAVLQRGNF